MQHHLLLDGVVMVEQVLVVMLVLVVEVVLVVMGVMVLHPLVDKVDLVFNFQQHLEVLI